MCSPIVIVLLVRSCLLIALIISDYMSHDPLPSPRFINFIKKQKKWYRAPSLSSQWQGHLMSCLGTAKNIKKETSNIANHSSPLWAGEGIAQRCWQLAQPWLFNKLKFKYPPLQNRTRDKKHWHQQQQQFSWRLSKPKKCTSTFFKSRWYYVVQTPEIYFQGKKAIVQKSVF